jgi:hypothetical protein
VNLDRLKDRLSNVRPSSSGFTAQCPAHDDGHNSLSVSTGEDGRILVKCFAGCPVDKVVSALGLAMEDLFDNRSKENYKSIPPKSTASLQHLGRIDGGATSSSGCTLAEYSEKKGLPVNFLQSIGVHQRAFCGSPAVRMSYTNAAGEEIAVRYRIALAKSEYGDNRFRWQKGTKPCLYGLWRLTEARAIGYIIVVEGESDAQTLWFHSLPAIGIPGASIWKEEWSAELQDLDTVYVVVEPDAGGDAVMAWVGKSSIRDRVRLIRMSEEAKDPSSLYLSAPASFVERWNDLIGRSVPWSAYAVDVAEEARSTAWQICSELANSHNLLDRLDGSLRAMGFSGKTDAAKVLYLAVTSRLFRRPVSVVVKGPSSAGKSFLTECVLAHFPTSAYYALSAMSDRALAYSDEPLRHRVLVIYEAAGMASETATYLIRSLLSEGCVRYETVEKTPEGMRSRLIEREGPTGLLLTTTAVSLHPENETRLLSINVTDSPEQTRDIMMSIASKASGMMSPTTANSAWLKEWLALQEWLSQESSAVVIPYAPALAKLVPPTSTRLRRDFSTIVSMVSAHALLHRATRQIDAGGAVIATLADYEAVYELSGDMFAETAARSVSSSVRETVGAVQGILASKSNEATVSIAELAACLGLDKSAISRRVKVAINSGYLENREERRGKPASVALGVPIPDNDTFLPLPATLAECCSVARESGGYSTFLSSEARIVEVEL